MVLGEGLGPLHGLVPHTPLGWEVTHLLSFLLPQSHFKTRSMWLGG